MKITFCVLGILCFAGMAFGQAGSATSSGISAEPIVYEFQSHSARAAQQGMGQAQDIMEQSVNVQAHGVRPAAERAHVRKEGRDRLEQLSTSLAAT
jgi:hypothetical protein